MCNIIYIYAKFSEAMRNKVNIKTSSTLKELTDSVKKQNCAFFSSGRNISLFHD